MKRSNLNGNPQVVMGDAHQSPMPQAMAPIPNQQLVVQLPESAQIMGIVNQVLANPDGVIAHAVSMIDEGHNSISFRERIVIHFEED